MEVECPSCNKIIRAPDSRAGQIVKCPACGSQMQLPAAEAAAEPAAEPPPAGPQTPAAGGPGAGPGQAAAGGGGTKPCPFCGESILRSARKCKHCKSMLLGPATPAGQRFQGRRRKRAASSNEGTTALVLGILAFFICGPILAPMAILYGNSARRKPGQETAGIIGMVLGIIYLVLFVLVILLVFAGNLAGP
jgi:predicted RNA-binding Zn-ribbon protein involved in translation (DUF1610 family)